VNRECVIGTFERGWRGFSLRCMLLWLYFTFHTWDSMAVKTHWMVVDAVLDTKPWCSTTLPTVRFLYFETDNVLVLVVVMVKLAMAFKGWTHPHWASIMLSFLCLIILEAWAMRPGQPSLTFAELNGNAAFWLLGLLTLGVSLVPDWVVWSAQKLYFPADVDIINEEWNETCRRDRFYVPEGVETFPAWSTFEDGRPEVENIGPIQAIPPEPVVAR
jgi:hypothetical protein